MSCPICNRDNCHPRCPNYSSRRESYYCSICGEEIFINEEYINNDDGEYAHTDCFYNTKQVIKWLGYQIKTMEEYE